MLVGGAYLLFFALSCDRDRVLSVLSLCLLLMFRCPGSFVWHPRVRAFEWDVETSCQTYMYGYQYMAIQSILYVYL